MSDMSNVLEYVPERGDVVWLDFDPQAGHEQAGRRPALILSPAIYNSRTKLALACPITTRVRGYQFEVQIPDDVGITGVVLSNQVKSLDWRVRQADFICKMPPEQLGEVIGKVISLLR